MNNLIGIYWEILLEDLDVLGYKEILNLDIFLFCISVWLEFIFFKF